MPYVLLATGIILSLYAVVTLGKQHRHPKAEPAGKAALPAENASFPDILANQEERVVEAHLLFELKEKVEMQLAELREQKEMVTYLMMRVEKKLESQEALKPVYKEMQNKPEAVLPYDCLERARLHNDIYLLYDQGIPLVEIARQLGRGKGEVQLVLGLRN